jgi:hypothetical protein
MKRKRPHSERARKRAVSISFLPVSRSGDLFAPALDQKNQSDGEKDACDDPDHGCVIHFLYSPCPDIGVNAGLV